MREARECACVVVPQVGLGRDGAYLGFFPGRNTFAVRQWTAAPFAVRCQTAAPFAVRCQTAAPFAVRSWCVRGEAAARGVRVE